MFERLYNRLVNGGGGNLSLRRFRIALLIVLSLVTSQMSMAGTIPLNTGYDYSNSNPYSAGSNDNYWIRIASYPAVMPTPVGPSWSVSTAGTSWAPPMSSPISIPSTWINAFGSTNQSPSGASAQNPAYALYRKCFCLPAGWKNASIRGAVRNDEAIQIWLNGLLNTVLPPSPINLNGTPYQLNYTNQAGFRTGLNCLYVWLEDTGGHTGFDLAANLNVSNVTPLIATGSNMSFEPCSCSKGIPIPMLNKAEAEERETVRAFIKLAEERRLKRDSPRK